ncbi:hypothetical protein [uncultured Clostridium sp.]|uniref:hypothetical protein n=1 Tax=uncultured Clostridium sp. TaxID=59620 RepID=UPI0032180EFC
MILEDLICTNIMQRGVGNVNAQKMCRCVVELERIYGIKQGNNQYSASEIISEPKKTQADLANSIGLDERQIRNYKGLNNLIPELQSLIESGSMQCSPRLCKISNFKEREPYLFNYIHYIVINVIITYRITII